MKRSRFFLASVAILALAGSPLLPLRALAADASSQTTTLKGEVVDLMCYLDHAAKGEKHKKCAQKCIENGGPVGLLSGDQVYLVVGDHEPMNSKLAAKAGETVTLKGVVSSRSGMKMLQKAELE